MSFSIVKHLGKPVKATLPDGTEIYRRDTIAVEWRTPDKAWGEEEEWTTVEVEDYDTHIVYEVPKHLNIVGMSPYMCTCGSMAVIITKGINGEQYDFGATPNSKSNRNIMVCMIAAQYGEHVTSFANKRNWGEKSEIVIP